MASARRRSCGWRWCRTCRRPKAMPTRRASTRRARRSCCSSRIAACAAAPPRTIFIGNGTSELIDLTLRALLSDGDEVLVPAPDYPLWTAAVTLNGGRAVHYHCLPENRFHPDADETRSADHAAHARAGAHQSEQSDRRGLSARGAGAHGAGRREAPADDPLRRDLRRHHLRRRAVRAHRLAGERHAVRHAVRPVEGVSRRRAIASAGSVSREPCSAPATTSPRWSC